MMRYRSIGHLPEPVSELAIGWHRDLGQLGESAKAVVETAMEAGVNLLATSPTYGAGASEFALGRTLRQLEAAPMVATRVHLHPDSFARMEAEVRHSVDHSRRRLGRDTLDAVVLDNRIGRERDVRADVLDVDDILVPGGVADTLKTLVDDGAIGAVGITGLGHPDAILEVIDSRQFGLLLAYCNLLNPSATNPAHAAWRAQDYLELANRADEVGMGVIGFRTLAGGALAPHPDAGTPLPGGLTECAERELAADRIKARGFEFLVEDPSQLPRLAVRFALSQPALHSVIVGISDLAQMAEALAAVVDGVLDDQTMQAVTDRFYDLFLTV
jgi:aryl-alcohol dehydrogenase-like predicted oxidoreductase